MTKLLFKLLDVASESTEKLIDNQTQTNAETCDKMTELAQCELQRLIKELKDK